MSHILQQMNAEWFLFNNKGLQADIISYLIDHPGVSQWFFRLATIVDFSLMIGFFTKKFDKWLFLALVAFHLGNFFLLHISFIEQSLIFVPFLPWKRWAIYFNSTNRNDGPFSI